MSYAVLLEKALEERGNAILVIFRPEAGVDAVIQMANSCFANIIEWPVDLLVGLRLRELRSRVALEEDWQKVMDAMCTLSPLKLDMKLNICERQIWLGFDLIFMSNTGERASYGLLIGRDITESRRLARQESESQRLLASVFLRTSAPVVIVKSNGVILMSNPAYQQLIGYSAKELTNFDVASLTAPKYAEMAQRAREQQFRDGKTIDLKIETVRKDGVHISVLLTSVLLRDTQDVRVVTLLPCLTTSETSPSITDDYTLKLLETRDIGQLRAVDLTAFKDLFGESWDRIASRANMAAEQIIKRRLAPRDVFSRSDDGFIIWFDSLDVVKNEDVLEKIVRGVRLRFLEDFGSDKAASICAHVTKAMVKATAETMSPQAFNEHRRLTNLSDESQAKEGPVLKFAETSPKVRVRDAVAKETLIKSGTIRWLNSK